MKAFLLALVAMLVITVGANLILTSLDSSSAAGRSVSDNVRLD